MRLILAEFLVIGRFFSSALTESVLRQLVSILSSFPDLLYMNLLFLCSSEMNNLVMVQGFLLQRKHNVAPCVNTHTFNHLNLSQDSFYFIIWL